MLNHNSGKTSIMLSAFTHLKEQGKAQRAIFAVPSVVQGQFHAEALTMLEPGRYSWSAEPGLSREDRIAALKDASKDFVVVTHQALRDDLLHLAAKREGTEPEQVAEALEQMTPGMRKEWMRNLLEQEGISVDYLAVDEGHGLLNRKGKENSRLANTFDALSAGLPYYVNATADPIKNDTSEFYDLLHKMDPDRYQDRDAFLRRYGADTPAARESLKRELARHLFTGHIEPPVKVSKREVSVPLGQAETERLKALDDAAARAKLARMKGGVDVEALKLLSPASFDGVDAAQHEDVARGLNRSIGVLHHGAEHRALTGPAKLDALAKLAAERKGQPGVVFVRYLDTVEQAAERLKAQGLRVVTLTGKDSARDKDRVKAAFKRGDADVLIASDAGAVGANLQTGRWLVQMDTPQTAMLHAQRRGRIHRIGQKNDVELIDLVADHATERQARKRLADKYELRGIATSPMEGLDDTGVAAMLARVRAGEQEAAHPLYASVPEDAAAAEPEPDAQQAMFV